MRQLHFLFDGFRSPNSRALVFPLLVLRDRLARQGIRIRFFDSLADGLTDCDAVLIDSKFFREWWAHRADAATAILEKIATERPVLWFDTGDSAGWIKAEVLPYVRRYYKNQLHRDRETYLRPLYGHRLFTDFYHDRFAVEDTVPSTQAPLTNPADIDKLSVSWNSGLADYSLWGPYRMALHQRLPWRPLLAFPRRFHPPDADRPVPVSCRFGTTYDRPSVAFQRQEIARLLTAWRPGDRLKRRAYMRELERSRVVISPFGFGEVCYRDFETFLAGALLLKPRMTDIETWPDLFVENETMIGFDWDLENLEETLQAVLDNPAQIAQLAAAGQARYRHYVATDEGHDVFCRRLSSMVEDALQ